VSDTRPVVQLLVTEATQHQEAVRAQLEQAKNKGLLDVLIVGSLSGGRYYMAWSPSMNRTEQIGYLEMAKHQILSAKLADED
jgi:hypothetical protein